MAKAVLLRRALDAVAEAGARLVGSGIWDKYQRWPCYSKFFDNMGPIPHHMHQQFEHAKLTGQEQKAVKTTAFDLKLNPANPGMQLSQRVICWVTVCPPNG